MGSSPFNSRYSYDTRMHADRHAERPDKAWRGFGEPCMKFSSVASSTSDFALPSGDSVDVLFINKDEWIGAEVKSAISTEADLVRGIFQCIKYRAVIEAYQASMNLAQSARVVLVLSGVLPPALVALKNMLGVEVLENIKKK